MDGNQVTLLLAVNALSEKLIFMKAAYLNFVRKAYQITYIRRNLLTIKVILWSVSSPDFLEKYQLLKSFSLFSFMLIEDIKLKYDR